VDARLLGRTLAQLARELLAGGAVGIELGLQRLDLGDDRGSRLLQRGGEALGYGHEPLVALAAAALVLEPALALPALPFGTLDELALGRDRALDLLPALRGRALVGSVPALLDQPARVPLGLGGLVAGATGLAYGALGGVALGVGLAHRLLGGLHLGERRAFGLRGGLNLAEQLLAAVALGEHPVLAARRDLAKLTRRRRPDAAVPRDGDRAEVPEAFDLLDDPDVGEDRRGEPLGGGVARGLDVGGERLRAGGRRSFAGSGLRHDQRRAAVLARAIEQRGARGEISGHRRAQLRAERGGERELIARGGRERVGERGRSARSARVRAQELVDLRELGADAGRLSPRSFGGGVQLAPGRAGGLGGGVDLAARGKRGLGGGGALLDHGGGGRAALLELRELTLQAGLAILGELGELGLQRGDPLGRAVVAGVLGSLGFPHLDRRPAALGAQGQLGRQALRGVQP
jgi:hypothetical protein